MSRSSSNIIFSNLITQQNVIENLCNLQIINSNYIMNYHYLDYVKDGKINRFIKNDIYDGNLTITSNLTTSNLNVIGDTTILNTTLYQTEQFQVISDTNAPAILIRQNNNFQNVAEFYQSTNPSLILNPSGSILINRLNDVDVIEKLELTGNFRIRGDFYPYLNNAYNIGKISNRILNLYSSNISSSNISIVSYNNPALFINQIGFKNPVEIYNNSFPTFIISPFGNIAINKTDPIEKLDISGNIRISGNIYPEIDNLFVLGNNNNKWQNITTNNFNSSNIFTIFTTSSNIKTSNLNIFNNTTSPSLTLQQLNSSQNVAEFYSNTNPSLIISSNGFIGINKSSDINERLDINGNLRINGDVYPTNNQSFNIGREFNRFQRIFSSNSFTSNIFASNINIISRNNTPSLVINNINEKNIFETYFNDNPALIINSVGNIAINKYDIDIQEKVEIIGNIKIYGHIYPELDISFDLGKNTNKIRNLYSSNVFSSNLTITSANTNPSLVIINQNNKNLLETYSNNSPAFIISANGNIAINKEDEGVVEKVEIVGNMMIKGHIYPEDRAEHEI